MSNNIFEVRVLNPNGMHARPAKSLVTVIKEVGGVIKLRNATKDSKWVVGKSMTGILAIGLQHGDMLEVMVEEGDFNAAQNQITTAVKEGLGETPLPYLEDNEDADSSNSNETSGDAQGYNLAPDGVAIELDKPTEPFTCVGVAPGIGIGPVFKVERLKIEYIDTIGKANSTEESEITALVNAIGNARSIILAKKERLDHLPGGESAIMEAHLDIADDPDIYDTVVAEIRKGFTAAHAWDTDMQKRANEQAASDDPMLAERAADIRDVGYQVLSILTGNEKSVQEPDEPYILVTKELGPADAATLDPERVMGICTLLGGTTSHSFILARALGIPAITNAHNGIMKADNGEMFIIDGKSGTGTLNPTEEELVFAKERQERLRKAQELSWDKRHETAITLDGIEVEVAGNIAGADEVPDLLESGAMGVGLMRTEMYFMGLASAPTYEEQVEAYSSVVKQLKGLPLVARLLDVGGDKPIRYLYSTKEDNPFLGIRGIRLLLRRPQILRDQLGALIAASIHGPVRIMVPMIADIEEVRAVRAIYDDLCTTIKHGDDLQFGTMVEVPSAAVLAHVIAKEVDFLSIGTNDLAQYTLAADRGHAEISCMADPLHPAVINLISMVCKAGKEHGAWVGICGELGADEDATAILIGLGVTELSMNKKRVPFIKERVRCLSMSEAQTLALKALEQSTAAEVRKLSQSM